MPNSDWRDVPDDNADVFLRHRDEGIGYHDASAQDAWRRIDAFFDRHVAERAA